MPLVPELRSSTHHARRVAERPTFLLRQRRLVPSTSVPPDVAVATSAVAPRRVRNVVPAAPLAEPMPRLGPSLDPRLQELAKLLGLSRDGGEVLRHVDRHAPRCIPDPPDVLFVHVHLSRDRADVAVVERERGIEPPVHQFAWHDRPSVSPRVPAPGALPIRHPYRLHRLGVACASDLVQLLTLEGVPDPSSLQMALATGGEVLVAGEAGHRLPGGTDVAEKLGFSTPIPSHRPVRRTFQDSAGLQAAVAPGAVPLPVVLPRLGATDPASAGPLLRPGSDHFLENLRK